MLLLFAATILATQADLSIDNYALSSARPAGPIGYFIQMRNHGPDAAANVTLSNPIPPNTTFISEQHPAGTSCTTPVVGGRGTITCTIPTLASGAMPLFYFVVQVDSAAAEGTVIADTVTVASADDGNSSNNSATTMTTVIGSPYISTDLAIASTGPGSALAGAPVSYSISIQNKGAVEASLVSVVDAISANSTLVSGAQNSGPRFTCTTSPGSRRGMRCDIDAFPAGAVATFTVVARVDPGCPTSMISNTVSIDSDTPDLIGPNEATTLTAVTAVPGSTADLSVNLGIPRTVPPGGALTSYADVINTGPADASNVTVMIPVPAEARFLSASPGCITPDPGGTGVVRCSIPSIANGASVRFTSTIQVSVKPSSFSISDSASVSSDTSDPDMTYNLATSQVLIDAADLAISATADRASVVAGGQFALTIQVTNTGPAPASAVVVEGTLPAGATLVSAKPSQGQCNGSSCPLGVIAAGGRATVILTIAAPAATGPITNVANVTSSTIDLSPKNNAATVTVTAVPPIRCSRLLRGRCSE